MDWMGEDTMKKKEEAWTSEDEADFQKWINDQLTDATGNQAVISCTDYEENYVIQEMNHRGYNAISISSRVSGFTFVGSGSTSSLKLWILFEKAGIK